MLTSFSTLSDKGRAISLCTHSPKKTGSSPDFHCGCLTMQSRNTLLVKIDDSQRWRFGSGRLSNHDRSVFANCLTKGASAWSAIVQFSPQRYGVCIRRLSYGSRNSTPWSTSKLCGCLLIALFAYTQLLATPRSNRRVARVLQPRSPTCQIFSRARPRTALFVAIRLLLLSHGHTRERQDREAQITNVPRPQVARRRRGPRRPLEKHIPRRARTREKWAPFRASW